MKPEISFERPRGLDGEVDLVGLGVDDRDVDDVGPCVVLRCRQRQDDDAVARGHVLELLLDAAQRTLGPGGRRGRGAPLEVAQVALAGQVPPSTGSFRAASG